MRFKFGVVCPLLLVKIKGRIHKIGWGGGGLLPPPMHEIVKNVAKICQFELSKYAVIVKFRNLLAVKKFFCL